MRVADADLHSARDGGGWAAEWVKPAAFCMYSTVQIGGYLPFTEAASSPIYRNSNRLQWCACTPAFIRAKSRIPSPFLHAHSGLLASPVAPSRFEAAVMAGLFFFSSQAGTIVLRWSKRGDSLGVGAVKNPNAWRRLGSRSWTEPCHAGTEGFRVSV